MRRGSGRRQSHYRAIAERWLAILETFDLPSIVTTHGHPQPLRSDVENVLQCAAIAGDRDLARRMALAYPVPATGPEKAPQFEVRFRILRHMLAGDDTGEAESAAQLTDGYPTDFPPERVEIPLGIVRKDPELILRGMKAVNTRFAGRWDLKKALARHAKLVADNDGRSKVVPLEKFLHENRQALVSLKWLVSMWSLAFLNIARWRGIPGVFDRPADFSEWVPLELC